MKLPAVKPADSHPFAVLKKYRDPAFYRTWTDAVGVLKKDLKGLRESWFRLKAVDAVAAVEALQKQVGMLPPGKGAVVDGVVDPVTGTRYQAEIRVREQLS